jgi:uncharacterized delta-60 repeat protein
MRYFYSVVFINLLFFVSLQAQTIDTNFQDPLPLRAAQIQAIKLQDDGKILLGGDISFYETHRVHNLIRLNADGSLDETFNFNHEGDFVVMDIEIQNTGDIFILTRPWESARSRFTSYESSILQVSPNGVLKNEIKTSESNAVAVQDDGKFLVCGRNYPEGYLHRYNSDFSEDEAFNNVVTFNDNVTDVVVNNGKVFVSGMFSLVNGVVKNDIVKLNMDGSIDTSFDTGAGTENYIGKLTIQDNGKILPGETAINSFDGIRAYGMIRLNTDGSVDQTFQGPQLNGGASKSVVNGDKIYVAAFITLNGRTRDYLFRLDSNGWIDAAFEPIPLEQFGSFELNIALANDDVITDRSALNGNIFGVSRYEPTGNLITSFSPEVSRFGTLTIGDYLDEKLLVAGDFVRINGFESFGIARLNLDGSLDESFKLPTNKGAVMQVEIIDSDNILVSTYSKFFKLDSKGELKSDFNFEPFRHLYEVIKFESLPDGKIMAAGPNNIYRLNADGSEDPSFAIGEGICCTRSTGFDFDMQGEKAIYGSAFDEINSVGVNKLARLNADATVDLTFDIGAGPQGDLYSGIFMIKVLDNKEIIVGGNFSEFDGEMSPFGIVKLSANGSLDSTFNANQKTSTGPGEVSFLSAAVDQLGDKIIIRQPNVKSLYILNTDGTVDSDFSIPTLVDLINDIITFDPDINNGRVSKDQSSNRLMFVLGSFKKAGSNDPAFLLKMIVNPDDVMAIEDPNNTLLKMSVYPSPASDFLKIKFKEAQGNYRIALYDVSGKQHLESSFSKTSETDVADLDLRNTPSGLYLVKVTSSSGKRATVKVNVMK